MNDHFAMDLLRAQTTLSELGNKSLARIVCDLINENEPLLKAEVRGTDITVTERGGPAVMIVTVREA